MADRTLHSVTGPVRGSEAFKVPGSKSISNRALILAALAKGESRLKGLVMSDDSRHMLKALKSLGFELSWTEEGTVVLKGCGGELKGEGASEVFVGNAGTAARFLPCLVAATGGKALFRGDPRMSERPMRTLLDLLRAQGSDIQGDAYPFDMTGGGLKGGEIGVAVHDSSQFASGLLMAAPYASGDVTLRLSGREQVPYVAMTAAMMRQFGVETKKDGDEWRVPRGVYQGREYEVEPDMSGAAYVFAAAALMGGKVTVEGLTRASMQGDIAFLQVLRHMGCEFFEDPDGLTLEKDPQQPLKGVDVDMNAFSDQALTLAALAPFCDSPVRIRNVAHIRKQECDRLEAMNVNLRAMGINVELAEDGIAVFPGEPKSVTIKTFGDHRVAMAFSLAGLRVDGIKIDDPDCVSKTFENYWNVYEQLRHAGGGR